MRIIFMTVYAFERNVVYMDKNSYEKYVKKHAPKSPGVKNCFWAFLIGGLICSIGQAFRLLYADVLKLPKTESAVLVAATLVFLAALFTGLGVFDNIAKLAGAGTLVPITGFANAVVAPAIDTKSEGLVLGVGAKIFTVAGPVLLYGTLAGTLYGLIYYFVLLARGA